jgi:hypothetical protein
VAYPFQSTGLFGRPSKRSPDRPRRRIGPTRWFWRTPRRIARPNLGHERLVFDPLEPRLLLNADVLTVNLAHDAGPQPVDHNLIVQLVQQTEQVNNQAVAVQRVQVVDQSNNNAVLAFGDLSDISAVSIQTGAGNTSLTIDAKSFAGQTAPTISFDGGSGQNNIIFDNSTPTNWSLTGQNSGTVSGNGVTASFQNVANLTGAATSNDTLTVQQGGSLSGTFDGGAGGNDSLVFDNGPHQAAAYTIGSQSSTITLDGQSLTFAGLESVDIGDPSSFSLASSPNVHAELSQSNSNLVLSGGDILYDFERAAGRQHAVHSDARQRRYAAGRHARLQSDEWRSGRKLETGYQRQRRVDRLYRKRHRFRRHLGHGHHPGHRLGVHHE